MYAEITRARRAEQEHARSSADPETGVMNRSRTLQAEEDELLDRTIAESVMDETGTDTPLPEPMAHAQGEKYDVPRVVRP